MPTKVVRVFGKLRDFRIAFKTKNKKTLLLAPYTDLLVCCGQLGKTHRVKKTTRDFPGGTVVKNLPASAGDTGSIPGPGISHMWRSN